MKSSSLVQWSGTSRWSKLKHFPNILRSQTRRESLLNPGSRQGFLCKAGPHRRLRRSFDSQQLMPRPVQWSGTIRKYLSMASQNRARYSSGETTVGIFPGDVKEHRSIRSSSLTSFLWMTSSKVLVCFLPESMKTWRNVSNTQHQWWSGFGLAKTNTRTSRLNVLSVCEFVAGKYEMTGGLHPPCWLYATTVMFPCPRSHNGCVSNAN